ncbi:condensation protein [Gordonia jinghuaiqii]|uniref:Condensation protein n=1 Tax=Gordonia jinghuaiqii TaxID=2758710 RepID=A0A7D7LWA9_9ACTN|nr:condensation domain-containing protein [Gordonia jinghuaiqii]MCR5980008.1 condensation protein [Gordonia jinghuaiqii]QMT03201.1 condensation protein [Gordonia jinghuaiqii]
MKFIQIRDEPIAPGGLVEWTPYVPGGLGTWEYDSRLTSHNHEQHLRAAFDYRVRTQREGGREAWLGLSIEFDEPLSIPAIRSVLTQWIDRHEVLRSHVVIKGTGLQRLTTEPGTVKLKMGRIGWYPESGPLVEQLAGSFDRATAPLHWPAYLFATVGRERSFTLLFAADHSLVDGYSLIMAQQELVSMYRAAREHRHANLPEVGSYVDFSAEERRLADQTGADHPAVALWSEFLEAGDGDMPRLLSPTAPGSAPVTDTRTDAERADMEETTIPQESLWGVIADDETANRFTAVCSEAGGTLTAGVLAAFAVVHHEMTGDQVFRCVLPRHTRNDARWLTSLGWFVGVAPFWLDMSDSPTFDQAVARSTRMLKRGRQGSALPFLRVAELIGHLAEPRFVISFIDTRYAPGAGAADAGRAKVIRSHSYSPHEVYIWINRTPSGLRYSARFPRESPLRDLGVASSATDVPNRPPTRDQHEGSVTFGEDRIHAEAGWDIDPDVGPVHAYLHGFAELVRQLGDASTFSSAM